MGTGHAPSPLAHLMTDPITLAGEIASSTAASHAPEVDSASRYPAETLDAIRSSGLLGLISSPEVGGQGRGHAEAAGVVERIARECGSSAMITCMHYAATVVIEQCGDEATRRAIAEGRHLTTLAFSEAGSRSHFWAPLGTATPEGDQVRLDARKSWVTAARQVDSYVWSSKPTAGEAPSTLWLVPRETAGLECQGEFDAIGLRGNGSVPVHADGARIPASNRLGEDGAGMDLMLGTVLPMFNLCISAVNLGLMEGAVQKTIEHVSGKRYEHLGTSLAELPTIRAYVARMRIATDQARLLVEDTGAALAAGRPDAVLRVLESKAAVGETTTQVLDLAMRVCGGMAFRKEVGVERRFRDGRAGTVMAPTTDQLYDFIGKALCGLDLF